MAAKKKHAGAGVCHIEIPAPNLRKAQAFYAKVFSWTVRTIPGYKGYALWNADGSSGGFNSRAKPRRDGIEIYLKVPDIDAKLKEIVKAGGKIVCEKTKISDEFGYFAGFLDPNGNGLNLWSRT